MNLPNEAGAWDADFSYGYLELLYKKIQLNFDLCRVGDFPGTAHSGRRCALIRHDVDVSLDRALKLAEREAGWGVGATYHVMIDSPFYDVRSDQPRAVSAMTRPLGGTAPAWNALRQTRHRQGPSVGMKGRGAAHFSGRGDARATRRIRRNRHRRS